MKEYPLEAGFDGAVSPSKPILSLNCCQGPEPFIWIGNDDERQTCFAMLEGRKVLLDLAATLQKLLKAKGAS